MIDSLAIKDFVGSIVPISRFNKGEAGKIFSEVQESGIKVVLKNNTPSCILLSPEAYEEIKETLEDCRLLLEAEERMKRATDDDYLSEDEAMKALEICEEDLEGTDTGA